MFDSKQTLTERLSNAVDLAIDFATLGEYGLEPVGSTPRGELRSCEADQRVRGATRPSARQEHLRSIYSLSCSPRRNAARVRGVRDASMATRAGGVA
jgi:hypothetical protein